MNTILIAEDEKFIRLGLKTMVQRASVPVGEILEARDGEEALSILQSHAVDLLITDIRMPKMDGIELVSRLHALPDPPLVLVVSGYDDFNYAVSMLRVGAQDYLLKPVERQSLFAALEKLENQLKARRQAEQGRTQQYLQALHFLMLDREHDSQEAQELVQQYGACFFPGPFVGFCAESLEAPLPEQILPIHGEGPLTLYVTPVELQEQVAALLPAPAGMSRPQKGLSALQACYREALRAWRQSFFTGKLEGAREETAKKPLAITAHQLQALVSLSRNQEVSRLLGVQARQVAQGDGEPEEFARLCGEFIQGICESYRNLMEAEEEPARFARPFAFPNCEQYLAELDTWLTGFCARVAQEFADYENKQKIRLAVQYIQEHFREQLNMAVVSNHVSMNYSLFSLLFKQYTGTNFVSYLQNLRIAETRRLLETTDWRVNEIGRRAGFVDDKHFLKVFKAATGFSPTEYRKAKLLLEPKQPDES